MTWQTEERVNAQAVVPLVTKVASGTVATNVAEACANDRFVTLFVSASGESAANERGAGGGTKCELYDTNTLTLSY